MPKMIVKKHSTPDKMLVLAVCDKELLGKRFENQEAQLDLTTEFYKGEEMSKEQVTALMKKAYIVNMVGENAIKSGIEADIVSKSNIIRIKNIPHAQVLLSRNE